jgi:hypothetical protein
MHTTGGLPALATKKSELDNAVSDHAPLLLHTSSGRLNPLRLDCGAGRDRFHEQEPTGGR